MKRHALRTASLLSILAALAAGCVDVSPKYERRTSVWVSDSTTSGYTENDARRALVLPADVLPPGEPVAASISFGGASLSREAREDPHVRPLAVAILLGGPAAARRRSRKSDMWGSGQTEREVHLRRSMQPRR